MKKYFIIVGIAALLAITGCLVSGTFLVVETMSFTTQTGFYHKSLDLTNNSVWQEHADKIENIEVVGFELWITNNENSEWTYNAYIDDYDPDCTSQGCFDTSPTKRHVLGPIVVPAATQGQTGTMKYISYVNSFQYLNNIDSLKAKVLSGQLNVYGIATGGSGGLGGVIDSLKIVITVNASDS